jgi:hypothetical protein
MPTFDGDDLIITLDPVSAGVLSVDVGQDIYAAWKTWAKEGNMRFPPAFGTAGGDDVTDVLKAGAYFFLQNDLGWRIRPFENDGTYNFTGNLIPIALTLPIISPTIGAFTVIINGLQPITQLANLATVGEIADAVLDEIVSGHVVLGSLGDLLQLIHDHSRAANVQTQ